MKFSDIRDRARDYLRLTTHWVLLNSTYLSAYSIPNETWHWDMIAEYFTHE